MNATGTPRLQALARSLDPRRRFARNVRRTWYWRDDTFVIDLESRFAVKYALELHEDASHIVLRALGRNAESHFAVRRAIKQVRLARPVDVSANPVVLASWRSETPDHVLAGDVLINAQRVISRLDLEDLHTPPDSIPGYWWDMRTNFGDLIGPRLISHYTGRPVHNAYGSPNSAPPLVTVGSIIDVVRRPVVRVWGTGLMNPPTPRRAKEMAATRWSISAVRGHLTRLNLQERLGWEVPRVVGDPGLLFPDLFDPSSKVSGGTVAVVPHYSHKRLISEQIVERSGCKFVDVEQGPQDVASEIAGAKAVVSTSLHGLIFAQAYGVPWIWLKISDRHLAGQDFKFEDFFSTLGGRDAASHVVEVKDVASVDFCKIARSAVLPEPRYSLNALRDSFPHDVVGGVGGAAALGA